MAWLEQSKHVLQAARCDGGFFGVCEFESTDVPSHKIDGGQKGSIQTVGLGER